MPIFDGLSAEVITIILHFQPQHLVNTAWSFAQLRYQHFPLLHALSSAALSKLHSIVPHAQTSIAWAFSRLKYKNGELFDALSKQVLSTITFHGGQFGEHNIGMALLAFSLIDDLSVADRILLAAKARGYDFDGLSLGSIFSAYQRRGSYVECAHLVRDFLGPMMPTVAANDAAMLLAVEGRTQEALDLLRRLASQGLADVISERVWLACAGSSTEVQTWVAALPPPSEPYAKEQRLLRHVLAIAPADDAEASCEAVEVFGCDLLPETKHWLKIAGGPKNAVLTEALERAPEGTVLEVGTYCGYSAARFAIGRIARGHRCELEPCVVSVELDLAHAAIARNFLAHAGLLHAVEVLVGYSEDVLPRAATRLRSRLRSRGEVRDGPVALLFFDQRGSKYVADIQTIEAHNLLCEGAVVIADNVLKPGAPLFLWRMLRGAGYSTQVISVPEFAMEECEDWMTLSVRQAAVGPTFASVPPDIRTLEWRADQMRAKTHQPDSGGSGVDFAQWAAFSAEMSAEFLRLGIQAEDVGELSDRSE